MISGNGIHGKYKRSKPEDAYEVTDFLHHPRREGAVAPVYRGALAGCRGMSAERWRRSKISRTASWPKRRCGRANRGGRTLSVTDSLTELYNSRRFYEQLQVEVERAERHGHPSPSSSSWTSTISNGSTTHTGTSEGRVSRIRLGQVIQRCLRKRIPRTASVEKSCHYPAGYGR